MKRISFLVLALALGGCSSLHKQVVYQPLEDKSVYLTMSASDHSLIYQEVVEGLREEGFTVETRNETNKEDTTAHYGIVFEYNTWHHRFGQFSSVGKVYDYWSPDRRVRAEYSYETDKATMTPVYESGRGDKVVDLISGLWIQDGQ